MASDDPSDPLPDPGYYSNNPKNPRFPREAATDPLSQCQPGLATRSKEDQTSQPQDPDQGVTQSGSSTKSSQESNLDPKDKSLLSAAPKNTFLPLTQSPKSNKSVRSVAIQTIDLDSNISMRSIAIQTMDSKPNNSTQSRGTQTMGTKEGDGTKVISTLDAEEEDGTRETPTLDAKEEDRSKGTLTEENLYANSMTQTVDGDSDADITDNRITTLKSQGGSSAETGDHSEIGSVSNNNVDNSSHSQPPPVDLTSLKSQVESSVDAEDNSEIELVSDNNVDNIFPSEPQPEELTGLKSQGEGSGEAERCPEIGSVSNNIENILQSQPELEELMGLKSQGEGSAKAEGCSEIGSDPNKNIDNEFQSQVPPEELTLNPRPVEDARSLDTSYCSYIDRVDTSIPESQGQICREAHIGGHTYTIRLVREGDTTFTDEETDPVGISTEEGCIETTLGEKLETDHAPQNYTLQDFIDSLFTPSQSSHTLDHEEDIASRIEPLQAGIHPKTSQNPESNEDDHTALLGIKCGPHSITAEFELQSESSAKKILLLDSIPSIQKTLDQVRDEAKERGKDVWRSWHHLNKILRGHEDALRRRWLKLTKNKRVRILLEAWPKLSIQHRPDLATYDKETLEQQCYGTKSRDAYVWPHMNLKDLGEIKKNFLILLNKRGRCEPPIFCGNEIMRMSAGILLEVLTTDLPVAQDHRMLLEDEENYGKVVPCKSSKDTTCTNSKKVGSEDEIGEVNDQDNENQCRRFTPGDGLLVLEVQQKTLHFLISCCYGILSHISPETILQTPDSETQPAPVDAGRDFLNMATLGLERWYSHLAPPDFSEMLELFEARRALAKDQIRLLKTNPRYFSLQVQRHSTHASSNIIGVFNGQNDQVWDFHIMRTIQDSYESYVMWDHICVLVYIAKKQVEEGIVLSLNRKTPYQTPCALGLLRKWLHKQIRILTNNGVLTTVLMSSPPLREHFSGDALWTLSEERAKIKKALPIYNIASNFWEPRKMELWHVSDLMDDIETVMQDNKPSITPYVAELFSDLGLRASAVFDLDALERLTMGSSLALDQEFAKSVDDQLVSQSEIIRNLSRYTAEIQLGLTGSVGTDLKDAILCYPIDEERTSSNSEQFHAAKKLLTRLWLEVDRRRLSKEVKTYDQVMESIASDYDSKDWFVKEDTLQVEESKAEPQEAYASIMGKEVVPKVEVSKLPHFSLPEDVPYIFSVPTQALDIFAFILGQAPVRRVSQVPRKKRTEVHWSDFVVAMGKVGFGATKYHGNLWHFIPQDVPVHEDERLKNSIMIHEPWENGRIRATYAKMIGSRLEWAYGWNMHMFLEEGDEVEGYQILRLPDTRQNFLHFGTWR